MSLNAISPRHGSRFASSLGRIRMNSSRITATSGSTLTSDSGRSRRPVTRFYTRPDESAPSGYASPYSEMHLLYRINSSMHCCMLNGPLG
jgi:hypothetical protein